MSNFENEYEHLRGGGKAYFEQTRGLIEVWGTEAVQFLNGLITNDIEALEVGEKIPAAFPNAKGRLLAIVRVKRRGDKYLFETEEATHETVYQILFRFTMAGDFNVEDVSEKYRFLSLWNVDPDVENPGLEWFGRDVFVPPEFFDEFLGGFNEVVSISPETYETIRIEEGIPLFGKEMDETTVVPETGIEGLIHYQKGCYIGQEVIARIHFLGKPAKILKGLVFDGEVEIAANDLVSRDGKSAGRVISKTYSPGLGKTIALGYVRNAYTDSGTRLNAGTSECSVRDLPFVV